jgi:hypothetical protein
MRRSILVAGAGRSGTTWLADIIASQIPCRIMFEPFHPRQVEAFQQFHYFHYMRPTEENSELWAYGRRVFTGDIRHGWIDRQVDHIFPSYRLIKEIRANLLLGWIRAKFPEVPLLFIVRHPCAVALSRMQLDWWTDKDIEPFLSQPEVVQDFLADKMEVIRRAQSVEEKHAVIWCVSNLVPLQQLQANNLTVIFYENLCTQPEAEIPKIFQAISHEYRDSIFASINQPSTTTRDTSAVVTGEDKVMRWKRRLSPQQADNILTVVREFGLDYIYGESATPLVARL